MKRTLLMFRAWSSEKLNSQLTAYRSWVKVPEHWTNTSGRDLWTESVTFTIEKVAKSHELWINGKKIGSAGILSSENFQSGFNDSTAIRCLPDFSYQKFME